MLIIITLLAVMGLMGTDLFAPSLPAIAKHFHQSIGHTQLTITLFLLGFSMSQLFYGPLSDRFGRKPILVFGTSIFTIGSIICLYAFSFQSLCFGRIVQGVGVGASLSLARVILRDLYHGKTLALRSSQVALFISLTPAVAPFLGGILQKFFSFRANFIFMLCYGIILLVLLLGFFKESITQKESAFSLKNTFIHYKKILSHGMFMRHVIIAGIAFSVIILCANILPFIIQGELKLSPMDNGVILLIAALGVSIGAFISGKVLAYTTPEKLVGIGLTFFAMGGVLLCADKMLFGTSLFVLMPLIFIITIACGFLFPNALSIAFSSINEKIGTAGAIYGAVQISISTIVNLLLNLIPHQNQSTLGLFCIVLGGVGLGLIPKQKS